MASGVVLYDPEVLSSPDLAVLILHSTEAVCTVRPRPAMFIASYRIGSSEQRLDELRFELHLPGREVTRLACRSTALLAEIREYRDDASADTHEVP